MFKASGFVPGEGLPLPGESARLFSVVQSLVVPRLVRCTARISSVHASLFKVNFGLKL